MAIKAVHAGRKAASIRQSKSPVSSPALSNLAVTIGGRGKKRNSTKNARGSLADRIQAEREQIFKALSLIECCRYASSTLLDVEAPDYITGVYELLYDLLDSSAGNLGCIAESCDI